MMLGNKAKQSKSKSKSKSIKKLNLKTNVIINISG